MRNKISKILSGVAGEHFVAAELTRRGYIASLTSKNTKGIDILASNEDASKTVGIQVKTKQTGGDGWILSKGNEDYYSDNLYYVFVNLNGLDMPTFYITPSKVVADYIRINHQEWLDTPGRSGMPHKDNPIRVFKDEQNVYQDQWSLLGLEEV